jgi:hypothetical protein
VGSSKPEDARNLGLVEPARVQVITIAAEVLGRLPADDVPAPLRAIARFAPAKRRQLGAAALSAVLDSDEVFRRAVAEVLEQTVPDLVAAVRDGVDTPAADPVDVAVVAYLTRPPDWQDALAAANRRYCRGTRAREGRGRAGPRDPCPGRGRR